MAALALLATCALGCDDEEGTSSNDSSSDDSTREGSLAAPTCDDWKTAYCNVQRSCFGIADCTDQIESIECSSVAPLDECVDDLKLSLATCADYPVGCDAYDMADTAVAESNCISFIRTYCEQQSSCGLDEDLCWQSTEATLNCQSAYAVSESYDTCLEDLPRLSCMASSLPEACIGVIKTL